MLVPLVPQRPGVEGSLGVRKGHLVVVAGEGDGHLEGVQGDAGVAVGPADEVLEGLFLGLGLLVREPPLEERADRVGRQGLQPEEARAREKRGVDLEVRVLGGGPDQHQQPLLHRRQEGVLLGLVEPMDLVKEQNRPFALFGQPAPGPFHHLPHVLHPCRHRRQRLERPARGPRDQLGQRRLPRPGRPPQDHRRHPVRLDQPPQRPSRPQQVLLADHLVERRRSHPGRQRRLPAKPLLQGGPEQVLGHSRDPRRLINWWGYATPK